MKLKKVMALALSAALGAGMLAGCGGSSGGNGSAASDSNLKEMTFVIAARDEFMSSIEAAMSAEAEDLGYRIVVQDAINDMAKQIQFIETCANKGDDAAIVLPVDADACQSLVDAAGDMKLVFVNRPPTDLHVLDAENVGYVGSDEDTSGYYQGEYLAEYFQEKGQTEIKYLMVQGTLGQVSTTKRSAGVLKALDDNGITATEASAPLVADYDRPTAQEMIQPLLASGTEFDCIIANNDAMALGCIEACKDVGIEIDFPIVGIDCTVDGAQAVVDGSLAMTVFQNPVGQGRGAIIAAINLINGDPLNTGMEEYALDDSGESYSDSIAWVPFEPVTTENVADYM
ncbi:MAG TPA: sugar ABC transporter substrate-binding protein [Candidatus Butyricicoccus stercorigallinarum]|nr:sugar ABC transporter substrate-binding protein [Candidatus Butyricicoccus stercorigallinarum]